MLTVVMAGHNSNTPLTKGQGPTGGDQKVDNELPETYDAEQTLKTIHNALKGKQRIPRAQIWVHPEHRGKEKIPKYS